MEAETVATAFYTHWIAQFGTPLSITTDQGRQFESRLFSALARMVGANKIHTTSYHPQSNGMIERWHRSLKAALMCNAPVPWPEILPSVLLGLRTCVKEDLSALPAQLLYGTELRLPGEFFVSEDRPAEPNFFLEKFREHIRRIRPTPTAHHTKARCFILKDLYKSSHVFLRRDAVKKPLEPPYTGPHRVVKRLDEHRVVIEINGAEKTISVDRLKPAFIAKIDEDDIPHQETSDPARVPDQTPSTRADSLKETKKKSVSFPSLPSQVTGGGVDVMVAPPVVPTPATAPRDEREERSSRRRRRKQELVPRRDERE